MREPIPDPRFAPPVHPQPGFFETTVAIVDPDGGSDSILVGPEEVERIAARPRWSIEMANARIDGKAAAKKKTRGKRVKNP